MRRSRRIAHDRWRNGDGEVEVKARCLFGEMLTMMATESCD